MSGPAVEDFGERPQEAGYEGLESRCDPEAFGSWLITLRGAPAIRVVWDGKDRWLVIQRWEGDS